MMHNKSTQHEEEKEEKTLVLWDINRCPIPDGFDPRLVGRRIESALKKSGCCGSGPLTITAIGDLRETGDKVLGDLFSTGIALKHAFAYDNLYVWQFYNPSPATIILISSFYELECSADTVYYLVKRGYRILVAYPERGNARDWIWKSFLSGVKKEWLWKSLLKDEMDSGTADETTRLVHEDESPLSCHVCDFSRQSFDDFARHLKSHAEYELDHVTEEYRFEKISEPPNHDSDTRKELDHVTEEYRFEKITEPPNHDSDTRKIDWNKYPLEHKMLVWWHINSCPIPDGCDPRLVSQRILSACSFRCPSSLTITAIGDLTQIPYKVLRELSSTGIDLKHSPYDIEFNFYEWATRGNPFSATIMLISGPRLLEVLAETLYRLKEKGYGIFVAYPLRDPAQDWLWNSFLSVVEKVWLWKSLLEDEMDSGTADETTRLVREDESPLSLSCQVCDFAGQSFDDFATHLKSHEHNAEYELDNVTEEYRFEKITEPPYHDSDTRKLSHS